MPKQNAALHSADAPDWQMPAEYVEAARQAMGGIDLDPMTDSEAQARIQATNFYTAFDDGLSRRWDGRVFLNPAGGLVNAAWDKLMSSLRVTAFIWVGFSLEQLQTLQSAKHKTHPLDFYLCIPSRRIAFIEATARKEARRAACARQGGGPFKEKASPSHGNYIAGWGMTDHAFHAAFDQFGVVRCEGASGRRLSA